MVAELVQMQFFGVDGECGGIVGKDCYRFAFFSIDFIIFSIFI